MKKHALTLLLILSVAINAAAMATLIYHHWQEHRQGSGSYLMKKPLRRFLGETLALNEQEIDRFQNEFSQDREGLLNLRAEIQDQQEILWHLLSNHNNNLGRLDSQIETIFAKRAEMEKIILRRFIQLKGNLPEEKQKDLLEFLRQRTLRQGPWSTPSLGPGAGKGPGGGIKRRWW